MRSIRLSLSLGAILALGLACNPEPPKATDASAGTGAGETPKSTSTTSAPNTSGRPAAAPAVTPKPAKPGKEITTASGLKYVDTEIGTGPEAKENDSVAVHYTGTLANGHKFDSSYDHPGAPPLEFVIGDHRIIAGWNEGLKGMKVGGKRKLTVPSSLGYGDDGYPPDIPPKATLKFDLELVAIH